MHIEQRPGSGLACASALVRSSTPDLLLDRVEPSDPFDGFGGDGRLVRFHQVIELAPDVGCGPCRVPAGSPCLHRGCRSWRKHRLGELRRSLQDDAEDALPCDPVSRGKGTKIVALGAGNSLPPGSPANLFAGVALAVSVQSASPAECHLVEKALAGSFLDEPAMCLIGDKAYDSDTLVRSRLSRRL